MNREIKFRAWTRNYIVDVDSIDFENQYITWFDGQYDRCVLPNKCLEIETFEEIKLMQFTGLYDKNGKEIYEGDFLKLIDEYRGKGEKPSYVIFKDSQWMMQGTMHYTHVDSINNYCLDKMEIIGNIYENPDLCNT